MLIQIRLSVLWTMEEKREIMLQHLSLVTDETFDELLEMLNEKESSVKWIMNAGKGEQNE